MNSLRTDDIIGAVPRIRHMPKNLYRLGYQHNNSIIDEYSEEYTRGNNKLRVIDYDMRCNSGRWDQSYHDNMYGNFPLSQYDPNPFIKQNISNTQRSRYNQSNKNERSVSQLDNYYDHQIMRMHNDEVDRTRSRVSAGRKSSSISRRYDSIGNKEVNVEMGSNRILSKQVPIINYEQLKPITNQQQLSINKSKDEKPQHHKFNQQNSYQTNFNSSLVSIHHQPVKQGQNKDKSQQKDTSIIRQKNIFRGIGFNIITNSKYQYNLQTAINPYSYNKNK